MNWLAIIAAALGIVRSLIIYLSDRQRIDAEIDKVLLKSNREAQHAIDQARDARAQVRDDAVRNPADVMSDDGFRRND